MIPGSIRWWLTRRLKKSNPSPRENRILLSIKKFTHWRIVKPCTFPEWNNWRELTSFVPTGWVGLSGWVSLISWVSGFSACLEWSKRVEVANSWMTGRCSWCWTSNDWLMEDE